MDQGQRPDPPIGGAPADGRPAPAPAPAPWPYASRRKTNGMATASLVLGVISCFVFYAGVFSFFASSLAVIFGLVGLGQARSVGNDGRGRAIAGLLTGILGLALYGVFGLLTLGVGWFF